MKFLRGKKPAPRRLTEDGMETKKSKGSRLLGSFRGVGSDKSIRGKAYHYDGSSTVSIRTKDSKGSTASNSSTPVTVTTSSRSHTPPVKETNAELKKVAKQASEARLHPSSSSLTASVSRVEERVEEGVAHGDFDSGRQGIAATRPSDSFMKVQSVPVSSLEGVVFRRHDAPDQARSASVTVRRGPITNIDEMMQMRSSPTSKVPSESRSAVTPSPPLKNDVARKERGNMSGSQSIGSQRSSSTPRSKRRIRSKRGVSAGPSRDMDNIHSRVAETLLKLNGESRDAARSENVANVSGRSVVSVGGDSAVSSVSNFDEESKFLDDLVGMIERTDGSHRQTLSASESLSRSFTPETVRNSEHGSDDGTDSPVHYSQHRRGSDSSSERHHRDRLVHRRSPDNGPTRHSSPFTIIGIPQAYQLSKGENADEQMTKDLEDSGTYLTPVQEESLSEADIPCLPSERKCVKHGEYGEESEDDHLSAEEGNASDTPSTIRRSGSLTNQVYEIWESFSSEFPSFFSGGADTNPDSGEDNNSSRPLRCPIGDADDQWKSLENTFSFLSGGVESSAECQRSAISTYEGLFPAFGEDQVGFVTEHSKSSVRGSSGQKLNLFPVESQRNRQFETDRHWMATTEGKQRPVFPIAPNSVIARRSETLF